MTDVAGPGRPAGLRERKKAKTRAAIREHAVRLFRDQGYQATTVEQIAAAAEISPATFFRYYPTKEDVVLQDDIDVLTMGAFEDQPPELSPVAAMRAAVAAAFAALTPGEVARLRTTTELTLSVPELRARAVDEFTKSIDAFSAGVARRTGRDPGDFAVRNLAGAMIGVIMAATLSPGGLPADMPERIDAALAHLEAGLPL
ncbi:MAG TPA: TetR family transcriptional regulator [Streptosporangiaceae bacterium]|jgi:AcrR family transcriptional regulator